MCVKCVVCSGGQATGGGRWWHWRAMPAHLVGQSMPVCPMVMPNVRAKAVLCFMTSCQARFSRKCWWGGSNWSRPKLLVNSLQQSVCRASARSGGVWGWEACGGGRQARVCRVRCTVAASRARLLVRLKEVRQAPGSSTMSA